MSIDYERDTAIPFVIPNLIRYLVNSHTSPRIGVRGAMAIQARRKFIMLVGYEMLKSPGIDDYSWEIDQVG